jgi:hypothetical protein
MSAPQPKTPPRPTTPPPPQTVVKGKTKPLTPMKRELVEWVESLLPQVDDQTRADARRVIASNPSNWQMVELLETVEDVLLGEKPVTSGGVTSAKPEPVTTSRNPQLLVPQHLSAHTFSPVTSVQRNGDVYASRSHTDVRGFNRQREVQQAIARALVEEKLLPKPGIPASEPLAFPRTQPTPRRGERRGLAAAWTDRAWSQLEPSARQPEPTPSTVTFANPGETGTEAERADRAVQAQLEKINATVKGLGATEEMLKGASPLDKVNLMRQLQEDANLQALVAAGLMKWSDVLMPNPERGKTGHVDGVDVGKTVINQPKLTDLRLKLAALGRQGANTELQRVAQRQRRRVTSGYKPSQRGDAFPGKKIWTGPRYMPGTVTNPQNVSS